MKKKMKLIDDCVLNYWTVIWICISIAIGIYWCCKNTSVGVNYIQDIGIVVTLWGIGIALKTYTSNSSMRKYELINKIYDSFIMDVKDYDFYEKVKRGDQLVSDEEKRQLNKALTLFDEVNYFRIQGLLDNESWEYLASEINTFAFNKSVWEYIDSSQKTYFEKRFPYDIVPFTELQRFIYLPTRKGGQPEKEDAG